MKSLSLLSLLLIPAFILAGCAPVGSTVQPAQISSATIPIVFTSIITPTGTASLPSDTPSYAITPTLLATVEPTKAWETIQPLVKEPMNCDVPCFWGIIPGKTSLDEARIFFGRLGLISREGKDPNSGQYFYSIAYDPTTGDNSSVTLLIDNINLVESIVVTPDIPKPKEGSPREWIAYSPETLIKRYGKPSSVVFAVGSQKNISINMIMYFSASDLIVRYSGYNMTPKRFCPLTAPFEHVRLWMGHNPKDTPSFQTVPLEKATSLTMDQFTQLMTGDPKKACFELKGEMFGP